VYGDSSPSIATIKNWFNEFRHGRTSVFDEPRPGALKKANTVPLAGKVMATVFWDSQGVIYIDYLEKGKTVTGLYYAELLGRFAAELQSIRLHLAKKKVLFHHDNASAHTSALAKAKLLELGLELLPHLPYSPDLAPCDFFLFPNSKKTLAGQKICFE